MMTWQEFLRQRTMILLFMFISLTACVAPAGVYYDPNMDFGAIQRVAVMPFENLTTDRLAGERVRDVFSAMLLSTGTVYVLPPGEVARGVARVDIKNPSAPSVEEMMRLGGIIKVDAMVTGVVREYREVRSGTTSANIISISLQMTETQTGKVVWTASSTKGGISVWDRLFGGGGKAMNEVTEEAVDDLLDKLFP
jgi:hypothetical protein